MSDTPKVSVIVPMYNPGKIILTGLKSLCGQTLREIEIILVNDGSEDETLAEARTAASEDPRIRILDMEVNSGPGVARNAGIDNAAGEYLAFMDADDFVAPDFLEKLYRKANLYHADIAKGTLVSVNIDGTSSVMQFSQSKNEEIRDGIKKGKPLYVLFRSNHYSAIYRHEWIRQNEIRYGTSRYGEDSTFILKAAVHAERFITEDRACYYLVDNPVSLSKQMTASRLNEHLLSLKEQRLFLARHFGRNIDLKHEWLRIRWQLGVQAAAVRQGNLKEEAASFLEGIRDEVMLLPNVSELSIYSPQIGALIECHSNLCSIVIREAERDYEETAIIESIVRCFRFASLHPQRQDLYETPLRESLDRGVAYYWGIGPYKSKYFKDRKRHAFMKCLHYELRTKVDPAFYRKYLKRYLAPKSLLREAKKVIIK